MAVTAFFYLFSLLAIASAVMVITARNPVHSVLFLILTFFNAAGLFILLGAEFLAVVKLHALPKLQPNGQRVDPLPGRR